MPLPEAAACPPLGRGHDWTGAVTALAGSPATGPLTGIKVLMMGGLGPGPFCGMLLAGLGADVLRVDRVNEVDLPPHVDVVTRRGQRSIAGRRQGSPRA